MVWGAGGSVRRRGEGGPPSSLQVTRAPREGTVWEKGQGDASELRVQVARVAHPLPVATLGRHTLRQHRGAA